MPFYVFDSFAVWASFYIKAVTVEAALALGAELLEQHSSLRPAALPFVLLLCSHLLLLLLVLVLVRLLRSLATVLLQGHAAAVRSLLQLLLLVLFLPSHQRTET